MPEQAIEKFRKQLNVFSAKLELFDGTSNLNDFISDFNSYCEYLGKDDSERLCLLRTHLTGEAKDVFRLVENPTFDSVVSALEICFAPTEHALRRVKAELFGAKQMSGETFKQFAIRIQNAARHTDISQLDLVKIAINGARNSHVKMHLMMAVPHTMHTTQAHKTTCGCQWWFVFKCLNGPIQFFDSRCEQPYATGRPTVKVSQRASKSRDRSFSRPSEGQATCWPCQETKENGPIQTSTTV